MESDSIMKNGAIVIPPKGNEKQSVICNIEEGILSDSKLIQRKKNVQ